MANNKTTYTLQIDAELGQLEKKLSDVRGLMAGVLGSAQAPKGLEKAFEKVEGLLDRIKGKASQPITSKAGFSSIEKDVGSANVALAGLLKVVSQISSMSESAQISFLPKDAQDQLNTIITSLTAYQSAIEAATTETAELAAARRDLAKAETEVANAQARLENREGKLSGAKQSRDEAQAAIDAIKAREKALEGLYEEQRKIEEFYSKPDEQGQKRNRSKKYAEVSMRPQDIKRKITELEGASAGDAEALQRWNEQLKSAKNNIDSYGRQVDTARRTLEDSKESYTGLTDKVTELEKAFNTNSAEQQQKAFAELRNKAKELGISLEDIGESYSESDAKALISRFADLKVRGLEPVARAADKAEKEAREMGDVLETTKGKIDGAAESFEGMTEAARQQEAFETKIKQFLGLSGAVQVLRASLRDAMQTIKELDATMTEMAVVTDLSIGDYWDQLPEYTHRANELGLAINDVYKADTLFYQQGLKTNEVVQLSSETMKMARIAGLDTAEATNRMTAALRGFNMELNQTSAQKVADVYSELAAITAADTEEISSAMTKTASIASSAGMEFETTAAFLSQIIETTRESAETAGTAMKTIIARFQELKKDPAEIGEVDGEIIDANKIEGALRSVGVALRDSSGQFRDLDDVFIELASKWDGLDKNTQRYIATIAAGSRQQSRFIAMMSDYGRTQELVASANNSAGASNKQFEKTAESLEFKINQLKNAWHEFTMGIMESDLVKFGVDVLTKFLEIVNKMTDGLGEKGFGGSLTKLTTIFAVFKMGMAIFKKFETPLSNFFKKIAEMAGMAGYESGKKYTEEVQRGAQDAKKAEQDTGKDGREKPKTLKEKFLDKTGITNIKEGWGKKKKKKQEIDARNQEAKRQLEEAQRAYEKEIAHPTNGENFKSVQANLKFAEEKYKENLKLMESDQEELTKAATEGWQQIGTGIGQAGEALAGVGMSISMVGGLLSSLGLEEAGEVISDIGQGITLLGGALMAIPPIISAIQAIMAMPPLGIILIILAAVAATIATIVIISNKLSLENRMKEAAEATEEAKKAAQEAKEAYDQMLSDKNKYDELQTALEGLTYGTKEWKKALIEANAQVLELLQTYPQLAQYITRGEDGQLAIRDEGWDAILEQQQISIRNSQALVAARQLDEQALKMEGARGNFDKEATIYRTDAEGNTYVDSSATSKLTEELEDIYLIQGDSLAANSELAEDLAAKYGITTKQLWNAAAALEENKTEMEQIAMETENIARANLTAMASDKVTESDFGEQVIDAFASSQTSEHYDDVVKQTKESIQKDGSGDQAKNTAEFKRLASEYGVSDQMTGDDAHDLGELYKAMAGVEEIPDGLEGNTDKLLEAIAEMETANSATKKMEEYIDRLESLDKQSQNNIAGLLSQSGLGMSADFAEEIVAGFEDVDENGNAIEGNAALEEQMKALGYETMDEWAAALNMTTEDLNDQIEKNARSAITARAKAFEKLNRSLGKTEDEIDSIGKTAQLSAGQQEALAEKIVATSNISGEEAANSVLTSLGSALDSVGDNADELANYLGSMNWQDEGEWERLPEVLEGMGIVWTSEIEQFVANAKSAANAMKLVDFNTLNEELKSVYDTLKGIKSGEQGREFEQESYEQLIKTNKELSKDFVQMGDKYVYIGSSMGALQGALEKNTMAILGQAQQQLDAKITMAQTASSMDDVEYAGKKLSMDDTFSKWSKTELVAYLEAYQESAYEAELAKGEAGDANALSYLDTKGLGLSFVTDFLDYDQEQLVEMMQMIKDNRDSLPELTEESKKQLEESVILGYTFDNSGKQNAQKAKEQRDSGNFAESELYSKALLTQAAQSGLVAEATMSQYSKLLEGGVTEGEKAELEKLEASMSESLDQIIENQAANEAAIDIQNRVADAIYDTRQKEIDKLSEVNESIQSANGALISKIQEQIDKDRQQRENEKAEENIANLRSQQAYLSMDTSGVNTLGVVDLNNQIQGAEQDYQDSLVDQALQELSDANEKAAEQRERQISLLQDQLDYDKESGRIMQEATRLTNEALNDVNNGKMFTDTEAGQLITTAENWESLPPEEYQNSVAEAQRTAVTAANLATTKDVEDTGTDVTTGIGGEGEKDSISSIASILEQKQTEQATRKQAVTNTAAVLGVGSGAASSVANAVGRNGFQGVKSSATYQEELKKYVEAGGSSADFEQQIRDQIKANGGLKQGSIDGVSVKKANNKGTFRTKKKNGEWKDTVDKVTVQVGEETFKDVEFSNPSEDFSAGDAVKKDSSIGQKLKQIVAEEPQDKWIAAYNGDIYMYRSETQSWNKLKKSAGNGEAFHKAFFNKLNAFETGGLADFTGPAWLDGTKSRPEYVLNAAQTERFFSLIDVLESYDTNKKNHGAGGDNYFDISINVEKLEDDYDVEQIADKIRRMIYNDATYRNVNVVNLIR